MLKWFGFLGFCLFLGCKPEKKASILFGGDVMLDRGVKIGISKHSLSFLLDDIAPEFHEADFAVVNMECPVTEIRSPLTKKYIFRGDPALLPELKKSGITHGSLANNHSYDQGRDGLVSTASNLLSAGITPVGYGLNQREACDPILFEKNGMKVALFASVLFGLEAWMYLENKPGMCQASIDDLVSRIGDFKKENPGTAIVLTLHWGDEYVFVPQIIQKTQARRLIRAGADAIIGHHPHVVQQFEWIEGKPVFYSLGNLLFDNANPITRQGILVKLTFAEDKIEPEVIPYAVRNIKPFIMDSIECKSFVTKWQAFSNGIPKVRCR